MNQSVEGIKSDLVEKMNNLFGHNPFASPVGQAIDKATLETQEEEDWALFLDICDRINQVDDGPRDALRAIRKKLQTYAGKQWRIVMITLTLLETCVKNCGKSMHLKVADKDFLNELIKLISPKFDPPLYVQEKVLSLIQSWNDAFRGDKDLKAVESMYTSLKTKGIEFPMTDLDNMAPIHTPRRVGGAHSPPTSSRTSIRSGDHIPSSTAVGSPRPSGGVVSGGTSPNTAATVPGVAPSRPDQLGKLRHDLNVVEQNVRILSEMLTELTPGQEEPSDWQLLQELNRTCRHMQQRVIELLEQVVNEEVTGELLRINDDLNNIFLRYERYERYRTAQVARTGGEPSPAAPVATGPSPAQPNAARREPTVAPLIDLDTEEPPSFGSLYATPMPSQHAQPQQHAGTLHNELMGLTLSPPITGQMNNLSPRPAEPEYATMPAIPPRPRIENEYQAIVDSHYENGGLATAIYSRNNPELYNNNNSNDEATNENEYEEIEKWLEQQGGNKTGQATGEPPAHQPPPPPPPQQQQQQQQPPHQPVSSDDFDRFLEERAAALDRQPNRQPVAAPTNRQRQIQEETENAMFAL